MPRSQRKTSRLSAAYKSNMLGVAAVDRAMSILQRLEAAKTPMTLTEVAGATGLYKSSVLRLIASLQKSTLVVRRPDQTYVLGPLAFRLGRAFEATYGLEERLAPLMQELVDLGMESPSFHVLQDSDTRLCLLRFDSHHSTLDRVRIGDLLPLRQGAAGKLLQWTATRQPVENELGLIEMSFGERDPSCGAVAGPVYGPGGLLGALSLSGPLERFTPTSVKKMMKPLLETCKKATHALGGEWPVDEVRTARTRVVPTQLDKKAPPTRSRPKSSAH